MSEERFRNYICKQELAIETIEPDGSITEEETIKQGSAWYTDEEERSTVSDVRLFSKEKFSLGWLDIDKRDFSTFFQEVAK